MSDLDAKTCVADLDARGFCRRYTTPLAMMGVALNRYFPGRNAMRANEIYVIIYLLYHFPLIIQQVHHLEYRFHRYI